MNLNTKITAPLLALLILMMCLPIMGLAGDAGAILIFSAPTVTVGENVDVTVKYTANEQIGSWHYELRYDATKLEYVSGADSGGSGILNFVNSLDEGKATIMQTVTFRAINAGDTQIRTNAREIVSDASMTKMNTTDASATMHIKASPSVSGNADLASLIVSPGKLSPAFSPLIMDYKITVDNPVTSLNVAMTTSDTVAKAAVSDTSLAVGTNTITITVTAGNGVQKHYKITATRLDVSATQPTPITPSATPKTTSASAVGTETTGIPQSDTANVSVSDSGTTVPSPTTEVGTTKANKETTESYAALKHRADKAENNLQKARILLLAVAAVFTVFVMVIITVIVIPRRKNKTI